MSRYLNLAVAQLGPIGLLENRTQSVDRLRALLREAADRGAELVVFPELALTTFFPRYWASNVDEMNRFYEFEMPNPEVGCLFEDAADLGVGFSLGYAELTSDGTRFNTSILTDRSGNIIGKYRKIHLPGHAHYMPSAQHQHLEKRYFSVGNLGWGVFDFEDSLIGMGLCNDRRWPETYRALSLQGAEVALFGYNTPTESAYRKGETHLQMFQHLLCLQAGAYQNSMWVAASAKCGVEDGNPMIGGSVIVAPSGEVAARSVTEGDEVIHAKIDLALGSFYREHVFSYSAHRRPEAYSLITERTGRGRPLPVLYEKW